MQINENKKSQKWILPFEIARLKLLQNMTLKELNSIKQINQFNIKEIAKNKNIFLELL